MAVLALEASFGRRALVLTPFSVSLSASLFLARFGLTSILTLWYGPAAPRLLILARSGRTSLMGASNASPGRARARRLHHGTHYNMGSTASSMLAEWPAG